MNVQLEKWEKYFRLSALKIYITNVIIQIGFEWHERVQKNQRSFYSQCDEGQ